MCNLYAIRKDEEGKKWFYCNYCSFRTESQGEMLRHHNPKDPNRCKERKWDIPKLIYLAAGIGERLRPLTYTTNKSLIEFNGESLTEMCLRTFADLGITEVVMIVGHFANQIKKRIGRKFHGMTIKYVYNPFYPVSGGAHSLWLARQEFEGKPCIVMDGDHLMDPELQRKLLESKYENCMLVDDTAKLPLTEETAVVGHQGLIKYLAWSPNGELFRMAESENVIGEAVVMVKLGADASTALSYEVDRYLREGKTGKLEIIEPLNNTFRRHDTWYISTEGLPWIEIDFESDLEKARNEVFPAMKQKEMKK